MEYTFSIPELEAAGVTVWDAGALVRLSSVDFHKLRNLLEDFGQRSAVAQGLRAPITDIWRLRSSDQRLYLQTAAGAQPGCCVVLGGLKVGKKKLFLHRANGAITEVEPLCVLDFYVHESHQRQGVGKALFEVMLDAEQMAPEQIGYDRPSSKLLSFLRKHYSLVSYVPQPNNFVVYEQFFANMPGSPGRGGKGNSSSTSSSACWGPGALASLGHGRQTLHVIGSRAAGVTNGGVDLSAADPWLRTSQRPPTASLQHCVHLHTTQAGGISSGGGSSSSAMSTGTTNNSLGGSSSCGTTTAGRMSSMGGAAAAGAATAWTPLGGPGCPSAGTPTGGPQQAQQQQAPVYYGRGTGIKALMQGSSPPADTVYSHRGYQQALLAAAANPSPPRIKAGPMAGPTPAGSTQQQQQQQQQHYTGWHHQQQAQQVQQQHGSWGGSSCSSAQDTLDNWVRGSTSGSTQGGAGGGPHGHTQNSPAAPVAFKTDGGAGAGAGAGDGVVSQQQQQQQYTPTRPFGSWEPHPGSLLPQDSSSVDSSERMSLRKQAVQLLQQQQQQQKPAWVAAGAGPPGHLLAAPVGSYAVPTAAMEDIIGGREQQQFAGSSWSGSGRQYSRRPADSLCLSWDGLPQQQQQQQQQHRGGMVGQQLSRMDSSQSQSKLGDDRSLRHSMTPDWGNAHVHRNGSRAAACMRMV